MAPDSMGTMLIHNIFKPDHHHPQLVHIILTDIQQKLYEHNPFSHIARKCDICTHIVLYKHHLLHIRFRFVAILNDLFPNNCYSNIPNKIII